MLMRMSRGLVRENKRATKRDAYYVGKGDDWGEAQFEEQPESDAIIDDIEAMFAAQGVTREQLRFVADTHGGSVRRRADDRRPASEDRGGDRHRLHPDGNRLVHDPDARRAPAVRDVGEVHPLHRDERRLRPAEHRGVLEEGELHPDLDAGRPDARLPAVRPAPRRRQEDPRLLLHRLRPVRVREHLPTLKVGSGNAAHINQFYCVPQARFLGVTPQDIKDYKAPEPRAEDVDIKRAQDALKNDPFFSSHKEWVHAIKLQIEMGKRAEQQAFAKYSLEYVFDTYLPRKLANVKAFLP